ncbi:MAG TPA: BLUF domain-containing protein [Acidisoma sp.]|jgi:hypothetical protein|uniref:BLUF domain-containing protein n=1 Tax=Acidisoma sp. TaxID=1872115 RepID=UPI002BCB8D3D|nr:BLUF domain-containing protein [Acidisoma sp.]HTI01486.1 BLUF domain-containing protein [Acidisoma sp.]
MKIYKIVYRSRAVRSADDRQNQADVEDIIRVARAYNSARGITGALLLSPYGYAQVLEGPSHAIQSLFGRIMCDRRHENVELLYNDHHSNRDFGNWAMALVGVPGEADIELASTSLQHRIDTAAGADDVLAMLRKLVIPEAVEHNRTIH